MKTMICTCFAAVSLIAASTAALADSPRHFLQDALEGDNSEIMLGRLAADKARSERVREFGRTLSDDHSQAREEVVQLGRRMGVRRNRDISPEAREERDRLQGMDGREFDREFIDYMIRDHQKDIAKFQDEANENHGPISDLAARQLPTLQKHLEMARNLDRPGWRDRDGFDRGRDYRGDREDRDRPIRNERDGNNLDRR